MWLKVEQSHTLPYLDHPDVNTVCLTALGIRSEDPRADELTKRRTKPSNRTSAALRQISPLIDLKVAPQIRADQTEKNASEQLASTYFKQRSEATVRL